MRHWNGHHCFKQSLPSNLLSLGPLGTNFVEILIKIFLTKMLLRMLSVKFWPLLLAWMCSYFYTYILWYPVKQATFKYIWTRLRTAQLLSITFERYYFLHFTYLTTYNVYMMQLCLEYKYVLSLAIPPVLIFNWPFRFTIIMWHEDLGPYGPYSVSFEMVSCCSEENTKGRATG